MRDGAELLSKGGTFQIEYSDDLRIEEVYFSMANASAYAAIYEDFYIIDGTFNTNRYGLTDAKLTIVVGFSIFNKLRISMHNMKCKLLLLYES